MLGFLPSTRKNSVCVAVMVSLKPMYSRVLAVGQKSVEFLLFVAFASFFLQVQLISLKLKKSKLLI